MTLTLRIDVRERSKNARWRRAARHGASTPLRHTPLETELRQLDPRVALRPSIRIRIDHGFRRDVTDHAESDAPVACCSTPSCACSLSLIIEALRHACCHTMLRIFRYANGDNQRRMFSTRPVYDRILYLVDGA